MSAKNLLLVFVFIFIAAAAFSAAYLFVWSDESTTSPAATTKRPVNVPDAQAALRDAEARRDQLTQQAQEARSRAETAKKEADRLEDIAQRNKVDTNDPTTRTAQARAEQLKAERAADQFDSQVRDADTKVRQAQDNLRAAQDAVRDAPQGGSKNASPAGDSGRAVVQPEPARQGAADLSGTSYALLFVAATTSTLALALVIFLFLWALHAKKVVNATTEDFANMVIKRQTDTLESLGNVVNNLKDIYGRLSKLEAGVGQARGAIEAYNSERAAQNRLAASYNNAPTPTPNYDVPDNRYVPEPIEFPIAANNFLASVSGSQQIIKPDPLRNLLVRDPDGRGQLVLVREGGISDGQLYIVPRLTRFQTMQDFYNHYEQFYDCDQPTAGEVWVNRPAVVYNVDGGWQLSRKGILEVKS